MRKPTEGLTNAEWYLMECLWEQSPRTSREIIDYMLQSQNWNRSTTLTVLRRMVEKGQVICDEAGTVRCYSPAISREEAQEQENSTFLNRVYKGSVSMMVSAMTRRQELTSQEIAELYEILRRAEGKGEGL